MKGLTLVLLFVSVLEAQRGGGGRGFGPGGFGAGGLGRGGGIGHAGIGSGYGRGGGFAGRPHPGVGAGYRFGGQIYSPNYRPYSGARLYGYGAGFSVPYLGGYLGGSSGYGSPYYGYGSAYLGSGYSPYGYPSPPFYSPYSPYGASLYAPIPPSISIVTPPPPADYAPSTIIINTDRRPRYIEPRQLESREEQSSVVEKAAPASDRSPVYLIAQRDGVIWAVDAYSVEDGNLRLVTLKGETRHIRLADVDRDFSELLNRERGVAFKLP